MKDRNARPLLDPGADTPALLRDAIEAARGCLPSRADLSELAAGLPLGPGPGGSGSDPDGEVHSPGQDGGVPVAPAAPVVPSVLPGIFVGAALGAIVSTAAMLWPSASEPPASSSARGAPTAAMVAPVSSAAAAPTSSAVESSPIAPAVRPPPAEPRVLPVPSASETIAPPPEPSAVAAAPGVAPGAASDGESEVHLLQRANVALGTSPAQALALTDQHIARFPGGALAQEREIVAVKALVALGRTEEARARAARFVAAHPGSAHRPGIEALLGP